MTDLMQRLAQARPTDAELDPMMVTISALPFK